MTQFQPRPDHQPFHAQGLPIDLPEDDFDPADAARTLRPDDRPGLSPGVRAWVIVAATATLVGIALASTTGLIGFLATGTLCIAALAILARIAFRGL